MCRPHQLGLHLLKYSRSHATADATGVTGGEQHAGISNTTPTVGQLTI